MIVKVQVPLMTTNPQNPEALIYNKDRSFHIMLPVDKAIKQKMGKEYKKYFKARVEGDKLALGEEVEVTTW